MSKYEVNEDGYNSSFAHNFLVVSQQALPPQGIPASKRRKKNVGKDPNMIEVKKNFDYFNTFH